jgi:hypothetical protein
MRLLSRDDFHGTRTQTRGTRAAVSREIFDTCSRRFLNRTARGQFGSSRVGYATSSADSAKLERAANFRFHLRSNGSEIGKSPR